MNIRAFNIETAADPTRAATLPEPEVKFGNTKDESLKARKREEVMDRQRERLALDPFYGKIVCLSMTRALDDDAPPRTFDHLKTVTIFEADYGEAKLLTWFWKHTQDAAAALVTFNGAAFDIPFITTRSLLNGVAPAKINTNPHRVKDPCEMGNTYHTDVMLALHDLHASNPLDLSRRLKDYAKRILNLDFPYEDVDQSVLGDLAATPEGRLTIKGLCEWNTNVTMLLFAWLNVIAS